MAPGNGDRYVTYKALAMCLVGSVAAGALGVIFLWDRIDSRVSKEAFVEHVERQIRWQDKIEVRLDVLARPQVQQTGNEDEPDAIAYGNIVYIRTDIDRTQLIRERLAQKDRERLAANARAD